MESAPCSQGSVAWNFGIVAQVVCGFAQFARGQRNVTETKKPINYVRTIQWKRTSHGDEKSTLLYPDYELHAHRQRGLLDSRGWSHVLTESASNLPTDLAREDIHLVNVTNRRAT
ncbi:hypothetical protein Bbelb_378350 [Branchiostoma belcheri]|nr:hypothetical protein Bbelb_378350 [Branchiostoma belcheri]